MDYLLQASTTMDDLGFFNATVEHSLTSNQSICLDSDTCQIDHTKVCVGDPIYCNLTLDQYTELLNDYISPTSNEWILIFSHSIVFLMGLIGNALVCLAVWSNHSMRTVTNFSLVNLAVADFLVILFCLPPTVLWDVSETWFLGETMCKIVIYFQTVAVTVSVLTLTFISIDRWYAICYPLRYRPQPERAWRIIAFIWLVGFVFDLPELFVLHTIKKPLRFDIELLTQCATTWNHEDEKTFYIIKLIFLYAFPLLLMTMAYFQIVRVLWRSDTIPGHREISTRKESCCRNQKSSTMHYESNSTTMNQLRARRKASKMLVMVVLIFGACYFPVHVLNILRYTYTDIHQSEVISVLFLFSHWLCYANSAINPLIYNFMSGKFRREFRNVLGRGRCLKIKNNDRHKQWQSQYRSRHVNEDQEQSTHNSTTHMLNITPSLKGTLPLQRTWQTSFIAENGNKSIQQPAENLSKT